ncbi:helix-turn-helix domain-containing protein [Thiomicrorhabdus aquaedulcis]|uniref:helix-turn-helix domain-containing protein n=1 Tax=Thiomicrorhabdus aquaedulcis TaxID=2211106 RepID=UPI000FD8B521|nr:helix-turn-helix transcriptional regulator [Thiomicrorhabdus aquaedulcis]
MVRFLLLDDTDVMQSFAAHLRRLREAAKLSRDALAKQSTVPASTIKKFELTGQISLRQLLLLWQSLDDLKRLYELTQNPSSATHAPLPKTIDEVLKDAF